MIKEEWKLICVGTAIILVGVGIGFGICSWISWSKSAALSSDFAAEQGKLSLSRENNNLRSINSEIIAENKELKKKQADCEKQIDYDPKPADGSIIFEGGTIKTNGYVISYPPEWRVKATDVGRAVFIDEADKAVGYLRCPIAESGYEDWTFTTQDRNFTKDNVSYEVGLRDGSPFYPDGTSYLTLIYVRRDSMIGEDWKYTCEMSFYNAKEKIKYMDEIKDIFLSIK